MWVYLGIVNSLTPTWFPILKNLALTEKHHRYVWEAKLLKERAGVERVLGAEKFRMAMERDGNEIQKPVTAVVPSNDGFKDVRVLRLNKMSGVEMSMHSPELSYLFPNVTHLWIELATENDWDRVNDAYGGIGLVARFKSSLLEIFSAFYHLEELAIKIDFNCRLFELVDSFWVGQLPVVKGNLLVKEIYLAQF